MHHVYIHIILGILYIMDYILYTTYHILSVSSMLHLPLYISLSLLIKHRFVCICTDGCLQIYVYFFSI